MYSKTSRAACEAVARSVSSLGRIQFEHRFSEVGQFVWGWIPSLVTEKAEACVQWYVDGVFWVRGYILVG